MASLLSDLVVYLVYAVPVFIIARKCEHPYAWLAFVPIANLWLMVDIAGKEWWWMLLFFVPFANIVAYAVVWMGIMEATNKSPLLGLLMFVPLLNIAVAFYAAIYEPQE
jgi:hypothetical protein